MLTLGENETTLFMLNVSLLISSSWNSSTDVKGYMGAISQDTMKLCYEMHSLRIENEMS